MKFPLSESYFDDKTKQNLKNRIPIYTKKPKIENYNDLKTVYFCLNMEYNYIQGNRDYNLLHINTPIPLIRKKLFTVNEYPNVLRYICDIMFFLNTNYSKRTRSSVKSFPDIFDKKFSNSYSPSLCCKKINQILGIFIPENKQENDLENSSKISEFDVESDLKSNIKFNSKTKIEPKISKKRPREHQLDELSCQTPKKKRKNDFLISKMTDLQKEILSTRPGKKARKIDLIMCSIQYMLTNCIDTYEYNNRKVIFMNSIFNFFKSNFEEVLYNDYKNKCQKKNIQCDVCQGEDICNVCDKVKKSSMRNAFNTMICNIRKHEGDSFVLKIKIDGKVGFGLKSQFKN